MLITFLVSCIILYYIILYIFKLGVRPFARKMVFLVTDGRSNDNQKTVASAKKLKQNIPGLKIFVVAVGKYINGIDEMANVASYPPDQYVFRVEKNSDLQYVFELALEKMTNPTASPTLIKPPKSLC